MNAVATAKLWAVVPVKRYALAKSRLTPCLSAWHRCALADAMLRDVLAALRGASCIEGILVVTADTEAALAALDVGAQVLHDPSESGTNDAVRQGLAQLSAHSDNAVLVLPSDVPLLSSFEIGEAAAYLARYPLVLVPDRWREGTNLFGCRLPAPIPTYFGANSFELHLQAARQAHVAVAELSLPGLSLDLDEPEDLAHAKRLALAPQSLTAQLLNLS